VVAPTNIRFPGSVDHGLVAYARQHRAAKSTVVVTAVDEWLRMQAHPRISFVAVGSERRAALVDGPQVWTVAEAWLAHPAGSRDAATVADAVGLSIADVEAALLYWAEYRDEIDSTVEREHEAQDRALAVWRDRRRLESA